MIKTRKEMLTKDVKKGVEEYKTYLKYKNNEVK